MASHLTANEATRNRGLGSIPGLSATFGFQVHIGWVRQSVELKFLWNHSPFDSEGIHQNGAVRKSGKADSLKTSCFKVRFLAALPKTKSPGTPAKAAPGL